MKPSFQELYEFFDKLPLCYLLASAKRVGTEQDASTVLLSLTPSLSPLLMHQHDVPLLALPHPLTFLSLLPSFLPSLTCILPFFTPTSLSLLPLPPPLTFTPFSPPSCSLHPSYHFGPVHPITLHLLSILEIPPDYPSFPRSICSLHSLHVHLLPHHLYKSIVCLFLLHTLNLTERKSLKHLSFISPFSTPPPPLLLSHAFVLSFFF